MYFQDITPSPKKILVVDDESLIRDGISAYLSSRGHIVTTASDGSEAWRFLDAEGKVFDCILTDLKMPEMGGLDLLDKIRSTGIKTPVILMSGHSVDFNVGNPTTAQFQDLLLKPFRLNHLNESLTKIGIG